MMQIHSVKSFDLAPAHPSFEHSFRSGTSRFLLLACCPVCRGSVDTLRRVMFPHCGARGVSAADFRNVVAKLIASHRVPLNAAVIDGF
jgi:hypothetical protein